MKPRILIVDDEESIVTLLNYHIEQAGYDTAAAYDGETALQLLDEESFDLVVLDLMLPKVDGIEVCNQMKQKKIDTAILMLTARDEEFDKVLGLELGADDYLTKPFSPREVLARIKAILRRTAKKANDENENAGLIKIGNLEIYPDQYEAYFQGEELEFTPKEFELLLYLARHKGKVLSRDQLLSAVWNYDFVGDTRIVDVHISHLREKIEPDTKKPIYIKTIRGLGYKMEEPK
ncbi:two-component system alkaline phosphatase synthesis response regulator PhoP [Melghiribacillus thermohalophilus]|uniref:Two-component system alkaline phosphatase synthesis response regulator PhoP n=1 Tax=Melghiribacillus thermohalophilus TaxID=1324956 RepID=A0A4V2V2G5_9BACI|nr:response regulator transcription factor [Melghiribacillus thermohalophilus]TCT24992.1 two-component system alkaline phosphatase synthesis response regulator PhoP [Melghiribacillus thermohalophilus]